MPQHKSAGKRMRTSAQQRERNRAVRSQMRAAIRRYREAAPAEKEALLPETASLIDNAVRKGILKENTANRTKSRLVKLLQREQAAPQG